MASISKEEFLARMPDSSQLVSEGRKIRPLLHYTQLATLVSILEWWWRDRREYCVCADLTIYYSRQQLRSRNFYGTDFFLVKGAEQRPRYSWVTWAEGSRYPVLVIELLSEATAEIDRTVKFEIYQNILHVWEYFWFSPETLEFTGFRRPEKKYQKIEPNEKGWLWSGVLDLYLGVENGKLRYFTAGGEKVTPPDEDALINKKLIELLAARAEQEARRAERLTEKLREIEVSSGKI